MALGPTFVFVFSFLTIESLRFSVRIAIAFVGLIGHICL